MSRVSSSPTKESAVTAFLRRTSTFWFSLCVSGVAFSLYSSVYGLRKAFSVATFDGMVFWGIDYKVWLVTFQVAGYALSKVIGIKLISEIKPHRRATGILICSLSAAIAWLFFAITPAPYNMVFLFMNGLPLGLIWGMVFGYLEGRRLTDMLGAGLCISFIFASGVAKTVGAFLMHDLGVSEKWMPFAAACIFMVPLLLFLWLIDRVPPPTPEDEALRTRREPMYRPDRIAFVRFFLPGIILFVITYMMLTAFRDLRDNFAADIWQELGYGNSVLIYTETEIPVALGVLVAIGSLTAIRNNQLALMINHIMIVVGVLLLGVSAVLFQQKIISAPAWFSLVGLGLYLGYVPFNCIFFERLLAAFRYKGNVGFLIYLADSFGYIASVGVMFFKEFAYHQQMSWVRFFISSSYLASITGTLLIGGSMLYFYLRLKRVNSGQLSVPAPSANYSTQ